MATSFVSVGTAFSDGIGSATAGLPKPASLSNGDILLAVHNRDSAFTNNDTISTRPTGFAAMTNSPVDAGGDWNRSYLDWKIVDGSEASTLNWIFSRSCEACGIIAAYRGVDNSTPFDVAPVQYSDAASDTSQIVSAISPVTANCMLLNIVCARTSELNQATGLTPAGGMTERADIRAGSFTSIHITEQQLVSTGTTGTRTHTSPNAEQSFGWAIVLRPAGAGGGITLVGLERGRRGSFRGFHRGAA